VNEHNLRRNLALKFPVIARQIRSLFDYKIGKEGVTRSQWTMIAVVASNPGATQRTISEVLEISEASAGRLIDKLSQEGLLERRARANDRRAYSIHLTEEGENILGQLSRIGREMEELLFAGLSGPELQDLSHLVSRLYDNLTELRERNGSVRCKAIETES